jgi:hypothetical protein
MADHKNQDPGVRHLAQLAVTTLLWAATYAGAARLLHGEERSFPARILLVSVAIGGFLPWVYVIGKVIAQQDEFTLRIHMIAIAVTFALTGVVSYACDFLEKAGFISELPFSALWMAMVVVWWISIISTARYYR